MLCKACKAATAAADLPREGEMVDERVPGVGSVKPLNTMSGHSTANRRRPIEIEVMDTDTVARTNRQDEQRL